MRTVLGLDPSLSGTGVIVLSEDGSLLLQRIVSSPSEGTKVSERMQRFSKLLKPIMQVIADTRPSIVCIEGYSMGSNMPGTLDRVEYGGLLRWSLIAAGLQVYEVAPLSLKKFCTGAGKGDKTGVIACLTQRYNVVFTSDNHYDAYGLARIAMQIAGMEKSATTAQAQVVQTVTTVKAKKQKAKKIA